MLVWVHVRVCMCACTYAGMSEFICVHLNIMLVCLRVCVIVCGRMAASNCACMCAHEYVYVYVYVCVWLCACVLICVRVCLRMASCCTCSMAISGCELHGLRASARHIIVFI